MQRLCPFLLVLLSGCTGPPGRKPQAIPDRPEKLPLQSRPFSVPRARDHRVVLSGGVPAYIGRDEAAPVLRVTLLYRAGAWLDPPGKEGLSEAVAFLLRRGGTKEFSPQQFDRALENRAIELSASAQPDTFRVSLWSLSRQSAEALRLLAQAVGTARFAPERLQLWKRRRIQSLKALHDRPQEVLRLYWRDLMWGKDHVAGRRPSRRSVEAIEPEDLRAYTQEYLTGDSLFVIATGNEDPSQIKLLLEKHLGGLLRSDRPQGGARRNPFASLPPPPPPLPPGVYVVDLPLPQAAVRIGHRGISYGDRRLLPFSVVSYIFGEGSFQSRLTERIRTQEGLTYGIFSAVIPGWVFPGTTIVQSSAKPSQCTAVASLVVQEVKRLAAGGVTEAEVKAAKEAMIGRFAGLFEDLHDTLTAIALLEYRGRPLDYYATYVDRLRALSVRRINEAARCFLTPTELRLLFAGDRSALRRGKVPLASLGPVTALRVRDPLK